MPLPKRSIGPIHVARSVYQQDELQSVELETVTNTTLTNIIRQLSSLSKHAEDVFGELAREVGCIGDRANSLQARIDRLAIKVTQLDSTVEEVPLTDITRKKAFKSAKNFDQQIFSRATMPGPMLETYAQCDKPPPLDKLNVYRDDGKDGLKFYTDPNYFFELWRQEMLKDTERVMHDKGKKMHRPRQDGGNNSGGGGANARGHKKRVRTPHNTREKQRQIAIGHGETLMPNNIIYRTPNSTINEESGIVYGTGNGGGGQLIEINIDNENLTTQRHLIQNKDDNDDDDDDDDDDGSSGNGDFMRYVFHTNNFNDITCLGIYEARQARPNSIELRRNYGSEQMDGIGIDGISGGYGNVLSPQTTSMAGTVNAMHHHQYAGAATYAATNGGVMLNRHTGQQQMVVTAAHQQQQQIYEDALYHQSQRLCGQQSGGIGGGGIGNQNALSPEAIYAAGTPSRNKARPTQPPPAPPSNSSGGTPTTSSANTPTRGRSLSTSRDALPPPPPIPDGMINTTSPSQMLAIMNGVVGNGVGGGNGTGNGSSHIAAKLLARTNSNSSRAGSPQLAPSTSVQDANALVMQQLNNTINSFNIMNMSGVGGGGGNPGGLVQQRNCLNDLPPPASASDQNSPKLTSPNAVVPPPPPPPPPLEENGSGGTGASPVIQQNLLPHQIITKALPNGDIQQNGVMNVTTTTQHLIGAKKLLPPFHDTRTDLMKAIRDGITLRKVEKSEQKEIERNTGLHDVASILARRVAIELSESEDSESEDSEGWMEQTETSA